MATLDIKLHLDEHDLRRIHVPHAHLRDLTAFREFVAHSIAPTHALDAAAPLRYRDADGDALTLATDSDLSNLLAATPPSAPPVHVLARCTPLQSSSSSSAAAVPTTDSLLGLLLRRPDMLLEIPTLLRRLVALHDPQQRALDQARAAHSAAAKDVDVDTDLAQLLAALGLQDQPASDPADSTATVAAAPADRNDLLQRLMNHPRVQAVAPQLLAALTDAGLPSEDAAAAASVRHAAICDICDEPIVGTRYSCSVCRPSFDLCSSCERQSEALHDPTHAFVKLKAVHATSGVTPPSRRFSPYEGLDDGDAPPTSFGGFVRGGGGGGRSLGGRYGRWRSPSHQADVMLQAGGEFLPRAVSPLATVSPARGSSPHGGGDEAASSPPPPPQSVEVFEHVSVPLGEEVEPGASLIKMWNVRNTGAHEWNAPVRLSVVTSSGLQLIGNNAVVIDRNVPPAADVIVAADVVVPTDAGVYSLKCALVTPSGARFSGDTLDMSVVVIRPDAASQTATAPPSFAGDFDADLDVDDRASQPPRSFDSDMA